jgi:hypothetical protein
MLVAVSSTINTSFLEGADIICLQGMG